MISSFFQRKNAFYHQIALGFNQRTNRGNRNERRKNFETIGRENTQQSDYCSGKNY
jgi:hypothetical protein